jgi:hypothetical protein
MRDYRFNPYEPGKPLELPLDIRQRLPQDHLALLISDVVDSLDFSNGLLTLLSNCRYCH